MIKFDTQVQELKHRVLVEVAKAYYADNLSAMTSKIPAIISPGPKPTMRCCIYKERAIAAERVGLALGGDKSNPNILEVIEPACDQCPIGGMQVSEACRGCLAHRCQEACHRDAISFDEHLHAHIDKNKCINCGLCQKACPYDAIINYRRPCEKACAVKAITERSDGISEIHEEKCTRCGACSYACPFGAIMDKSYIRKAIDISRDHVRKSYAIIAPSLASQFKDVKLEQVVTGIRKLGFDEVVEAALGADLVSLNESKELAEKGFCLSSCCPAFVKLVKDQFPSLADKISSQLSPMAIMAQYLKKKEPDCQTVFVGPCIAKKMEMLEGESAKYVDCVITFEELAALFDAKEIDLKSLSATKLNGASPYGRGFAKCGGLAEAVKEALKEQGSTFEVRAASCSGLDQCVLALKKLAAGQTDANFIEGMACAGGCIGGPSCLTHEMRDASFVDKYAHDNASATIASSLDQLKK